MTDSYVKVDGGENKKLQTYENTIAGVVVQSEATTPTNTAGQPMATGAGVVGATVPRVTLASDDPSVTALAAILAAIQALAITAPVPTTLLEDFTIEAHTQVTAGSRMVIGEGMRVTIGEDAKLVRL